LFIIIKAKSLTGETPSRRANTDKETGSRSLLKLIWYLMSLYCL